VLYIILTELGVPLKLVRPIKMCLNEMYSKVRIGKHLFGTFPVQNVIKEDGLLPVLSTLL
jgi:hypothetical protein